MHGCCSFFVYIVVLRPLFIYIYICMYLSWCWFSLFFFNMVFIVIYVFFCCSFLICLLIVFVALFQYVCP